MRLTQHEMLRGLRFLKREIQAQTTAIGFPAASRVSPFYVHSSKCKIVAISFFQMDDTGYWRSPKTNDRLKKKIPAIDPNQKFNRQSSTGRNQDSDEVPHSQRGSQRHLSDMITKTDESRFLVWVDAVGGYLVCTSDEVVLGQAVPESHVDIPILGDLARKHLKLNRTSSGYLLEPFGYVTVNGLVITEKNAFARR